MNQLENILRPKPRRTLWVWFAALLLFALSAWIGSTAFRQRQSVTALEQWQTDLLALQAARVVPKPSHDQLEEQKKWAQLRLERDFPWTQVFRVLEKVATPDIELLEFRPDKLNHYIVLRGEAKNLEGLLFYLDSINGRSGWTNVYLAHQQTIQRGTMETISFEVKANLPY